jgi:putative transposase
LHSPIASNSRRFDDWFDPIETGIRERVRGLNEETIRGELDEVLSQPAMAGTRRMPEASAQRL